MSFSRSATSYEVGEIVAGRYEITATVARGAFGCVYRAKHTTMQSDVAIKMLALDPAQVEDDVVKRFFREAQVTSGLRSHHTVRVFDVGKIDDGPLYMVMEFIDGPTLEEVLRYLAKHAQALGAVAAIDIATAILSSLAEAHEQGLVHRDLKPANIAFANGPDGPVVKVLDFGIAHVEDSSLTAENKALGTPAYMSPEQWRGDRLDGRSDLYALGIILYRCLTARLPFTGSALVMMHGHLEQTPEHLGDVAQVLIDPDLAALAMACLAKRADDRPESARALRDQLRTLRTVLEADGGETGELTTLTIAAGAESTEQPATSDLTPSSGEAATGTLRALVAEVDRARREARRQREASQRVEIAGAAVQEVTAPRRAEPQSTGGESRRAGGTAVDDAPKALRSGGSLVFLLVVAVLALMGGLWTIARSPSSSQPRAAAASEQASAAETAVRSEATIPAAEQNPAVRDTIDSADTVRLRIADLEPDVSGSAVASTADASDRFVPETAPPAAKPAASPRVADTTTHKGPARAAPTPPVRTPPSAELAGVANKPVPSTQPARAPATSPAKAVDPEVAPKKSQRDVRREKRPTDAVSPKPSTTQRAKTPAVPPPPPPVKKPQPKAKEKQHVEIQPLDF